MNASKRNLIIFSFMVVLFIMQCGKVEGAAKSIYIAQTARGNDSGVDTANAHSLAWINSAVNWTTGAGKINAGDTVHLIGVFTQSLELQGSGKTESPIFISFEKGAKFSNPNWNQKNSMENAAIYASCKSNITIDGLNNGVIECTDNGTNKTNHVDSKGIYFFNCDSMTIQNLTIQNIYVRATSASDPGNGACISIRGSHDIFIKNNILNDAARPIDITYDNGDHNYEISSNHSINAGEGNIVVGSSNIGSKMTNLIIRNNVFSKGNGTWSGNPAIHTNCMHIFAVHQKSRIDGLKICNNRVTGDWGTNSTSYICIEDTVYSPQIYNNLFIAGNPGEGSGDGYLFIKNSPGNALIANNTFYGNGSTINGIMIEGKGSTIKNNLFFNVSAPIICPYDTTAIDSCDNNIYYKGTIFTWGSYTQYPFSTWRVKTHFDLKSSNNQPMLNTNYFPTSSDTVARYKGTNLSTFFSTDFNGQHRPTTGFWDIGAFCSETQGSGQTSTINGAMPNTGISRQTGITVLPRLKNKSAWNKVNRLETLKVFDFLGRKMNDASQNQSIGIAFKTQHHFQSK